MNIIVRKSLLTVVAAAAVILLMGGCRTRPMIHVSQVSFYQAPRRVALSDTTKRILDMGKRCDYKMKVIKPGVIKTTVIGLNKVSKATVYIKYNTQRFSIVYQDSANLEYDPMEGTINHNYNKWMRAMEARLSNIYVAE